jgi:OPA family glycerol-6-phosphate transporter-like MFS transporter 4
MTSSSSSFERRLFVYQVVIFTSLFIGYACYAYNRKSVSAAMPRLIEEGLGRSQAGKVPFRNCYCSRTNGRLCGLLLFSNTGLIVSSQNMAYAISKFLGGILSDSISARLLFSSGLIMSGLVTIGFAESDSVWLFTILWFLNGFFQGAGWPACAKVLRQWFSPLSFGTWWSILSASANVSGGFSPFIAAYFILHYGWRTSVLVSGSVSVFFGILSIFAVINSPTNVGMPTFAKPPRKDSISSQYCIF